LDTSKRTASSPLIRSTGMAAILVGWLVGNLLWLRADALVRDGDEEGHVGAAELLRLHLDGGAWFQFVNDAWKGDLGEYPPLYPALVGAWWWLQGGGQPGAWSVRSVNLMGHLLAAGCVAWLAGHLARPAQRTLSVWLGLGLTLCLPLAAGLSRHFMPEGLLVGLVALSVLLAALAADRRSPWLAGMLGISLGVGVLVKQTFLPLAVLPVVAAGWRMGRLWGVVAVPALGCAGPWLLAHLGEQAGYVSSSVQSGHTTSQLAHLAYYPALVPHLLAGPVLAVAAGVGAVALARSDRRGLSIGLAWVLGLALFMVIPKKYPRLVAAVSPGFALLAAIGLPRLKLGPQLSGVAALLAAGWLVWQTVGVPSDPTWLPVVDEKCPQRWLRPPNPDAMGLPELADHVRTTGAQTLRLVDPPELPCAVQTTHPWANHLDPYLRREGLEVQVVDTAEADVVVTFLPASLAAPADTLLPSLGLVMRLSGRP